MRAFLIIFAACLAGCGVADVGTAAVTAGKLQAQQAQQAQQTMDAVKANLDAAAKVEEERLRQMNSQAEGR